MQPIILRTYRDLLEQRYRLAFYCESAACERNNTWLDLAELVNRGWGERPYIGDRLKCSCGRPASIRVHPANGYNTVAKTA